MNQILFQTINRKPWAIKSSVPGGCVFIDVSRRTWGRPIQTDEFGWRSISCGHHVDLFTLSIYAQSRTWGIRGERGCQRQGKNNLQHHIPRGNGARCQEVNLILICSLWGHAEHFSTDKWTYMCDAPKRWTYTELARTVFLQWHALILHSFLAV